MRTRSLILIVALPAAIVVLGGALLAYDQLRADRIAKGVRVAGVSVGGLTRAQARAKLKRDIVDALRRPIIVHHAPRSWRLGPREARISVDLDEMVDDAIARTRSGNIFTRSFRSLTGRSLDATVQPTVRYSDAAVARLLVRVRKAIDRPARDARVQFTANGLEVDGGKDGLEVRRSQLRGEIRAAIVSPTAPRSFVARTVHTVPKITTEKLAKRYPSAIIVNRARFRLTLFKNLKRAETYSIAVGQVGLETPAGLYRIESKAIDPAWHVPDSDWAGKLAGKVIPAGDPKNPIKARWMGIYDGAGIHGTDAINSIGTAASHGCIRMRIPDVEELYDEVPLGAPVYIA